MVMSADSHSGPRIDDIREYLEAGYVERFDASVAPCLEMPEMARRPPSMGIVDDELQEIYNQELVDTGRIDGNWDSDLRLKEMDNDGVAAEVMFFNFFTPANAAAMFSRSISPASSVSNRASSSSTNRHRASPSERPKHSAPPPAPAR
jgi:hypothetical protein